MRNFIVVLVLSVMLSGPAMAEKVKDPLPEFAGRFYLTVVLTGNDTPEDQALQSLLQTNTVMQSLITQTNYTVWNARTSLWMTKTDWRYLLSAGRAPMLFLQGPSNPQGQAKVLYFGTADTMTLDASLPDQLFEMAANAYPGYGECPLQPRKPAPAVTPVAPIPLVPTPPAVNTKNEPADSIPLWYFGIPAAGAGLGLRRGIKNEV